LGAVIPIQGASNESVHCGCLTRVGLSGQSVGGGVRHRMTALTKCDPKNLALAPQHNLPHGSKSGWEK
jgi:hypothetical protein